ncbi:transporter substrate-binding protein [Terrabacter terrigena]|uniref:Transporter substrate-binding protein n=1 Tax=Terrabacter terrigena TaxID=574718 RepID=A0ABW3MZA3_9MICO
MSHTTRRSQHARLLPVTLALLASGSLAACSGGAFSSGGSQANTSGPIKIGMLLDQTGELNLAGKPMQKAAEMAVADVNSHGGVLGRTLELKSYDPQSDNAKYAQYASQLAEQDKVDVIMGGITSASREAVRPVADRTKTLYMYNEPYEGGVCDKNTFLNGATLDQTIAPLMPWGINKYGPKVYVVAADYNFGHNAAKWVQKLTTQAGGTVVNTEFVPLNVSDFNSIINHIQAAKPDLIASMLVGTNHVAFYRAYAAAGLNRSTPILSETFGLSGEQVVLDPKEASNIFVAASYYAALDRPENVAFKKAWHQTNGASYQEPTAQDIDVWNGIHMYAEAAKKAGSTDRVKVTAALEGGTSFDGPGGQVSVDPKTHHSVYDVHIASTNDKHSFDIVKTTPQVQPAWEQQVCDLQAKPDVNKQFSLD